MSDIIAIGGGGFLSDPENPALEKYLLDQSHEGSAERADDCDRERRRCRLRREIPRGFRSAWRQARRTCRSFIEHPTLRRVVLAQDVVYVGGGNTKSMLAVWREWGLIEILKEAYGSGIVLGGQSAGAICWFEQGVTDSWADRLRPLDCMGFLPGSCCPHYDGEVERRPAYHALIQQGQIRSGLRDRRPRGRAFQERPSRARRVEEIRVDGVSCFDGRRTHQRSLAATLAS